MKAFLTRLRCEADGMVAIGCPAPGGHVPFRLLIVGGGGGAGATSCSPREGPICARTLDGLRGGYQLTTTAICSQRDRRAKQFGIR
jgi:hypothetical protein